MSLLANDLALALDPVQLSLRAGIRPDPWQVDVLRSTAPRLLLNCCRQSGKSTTSATLAVHTTVYQPNSLVVLLAPSLRQSLELFKKCLAVFQVLGRSVPTESETKLSIELDNGSRVVTLPGRDDSTIRGFSSVALLIVDEAARVDDRVYQSVRPMLAVSGGRLIAMSTPWGQRGWWYSEWERGGSTWERIEVPASACPRISAEFLDEERRSLGPLVFGSEYECRFVDNDNAVFRSEDIDAALTDAVLPLFGVAA